jgi:hypothetical protein
MTPWRGLSVPNKRCTRLKATTGEPVMIPVVDGAVVVICDGNVANMQLPLLIG